MMLRVCTQIGDGWAEFRARGPEESVDRSAGGLGGGAGETCNHCGRQFDNAPQRTTHDARCGVAGGRPFR